MLSKIDFKSRTLFGTHETHVSSKIASSLTLYSSRTKRMCQARLPQVSHSIRHAHKTHMFSKADFKSHTLVGTHRNAHVK